MMAASPETPTTTDSAADERDELEKGVLFPIVGIGASAGGLEAFTKLLGALPLDTGLGFVLVQHLDPEHESALVQILARATALPVREAKNDERVAPNHVYVIPRDTNLSIVKGVLKLAPRPRTRSPHRPIDGFFESLAQDRRGRAVGVVLSGSATDGTLGLEAIKVEGGITFAQDDSAKYDSMPKSAVAAGCVDLVLSPTDIAKELARIAKHPYVAGQPLYLPAEGDGTSATEHEDDETALPSGDRGAGERADSPAVKGALSGYKKILLLLRNHSGVDFALYKSTTIQRRITRRVVLNKQNTLEDYASFLRGNAKELDALYSDVLISVTSFFRNPETFDVLQHKILPDLLKQRGDHPLRCWVLGCSTGQEAYSVAIAFVEAAEKAPRMRTLQIFATDLNEALLDKARHGLYAKSLVDDVTPERLRRFFVEEGGGYRISKALREMVVFARQNIISDPPFSRMDLISCRNLLIYLEPSLQQRAMPTFHYALKPGGFLLLGASESVGSFTDLFEPVDKKYKIFSKKPALTPAFHLPLKKERDGKPSGPPLPMPRPDRLEHPDGPRGELNAQREADRITINQFAPPGVLVNAELAVLQFRGPTGAFLEPPTGKASFDVLKMARKGLMLPLRSAINQAKKENKAARKENVRVERNGVSRTVNLEVIPIKNALEHCFLILFEEAKEGGSTEVVEREQPADPAMTPEQESRRIAELESDVAEMREYSQAVQEQHEAANEELQAANEEVQSANEELQSVNEELETSKEELESANEELTTVNEEMSNRNVELNRLNNDLTNLQTSTRLPVILLGRDLSVRRFSQQAEKQFGLLMSDVGRPISHIRHNLVLGGASESPVDLEGLSTEVISDVREQEREVRERDGDRWYSLRVRPYLTSDNRVDGVVLVLLDITERKRAEEVPARLAAIVTSSDDAIVSMNLQGVIQTWNEGAKRLFGYAAEEVIGKPTTLLIPADRVDEEPGILERARRGESVERHETVRQRKDGGLVDISLTVSPIRDTTGRVVGAAKIARDITDSKRAQAIVDSQTRGLQLLADGASLDDVLGFLAGTVERRSPDGLLASIVPLNASGTHFQRGIGASLPDAFNAAVEGVEVSSPDGLCARAVQRREAVAVHDFNVEAWQPFAKLVAPHGLRSGWSAPIFSAGGEVLGTFANYYRHAGDPTPGDPRLVDMVLQTAAVAIERTRAEDTARKSNADLRSHAEALARFNRVAVGRELRMMELKKEINELSQRRGDPARYELELEDEVSDAGEPSEQSKAESRTDLPPDDLVPLESILCTEELDRRPPRPPDFETEIRALSALVSALADSPGTILQALADTVRDVLETDSAGLSLLTKDGKRFHWPAISGMWKPHIGGGTARDFGPCGDVLDCNTPLLFKRWERRYPYLLSATPLAEEGLLVPFFVAGKAVGTIWAIAHDDRRKFDREDLRQLESLGRFASAAYQAAELEQSQNATNAALNLMEDAMAARQKMEMLAAEARASEEQLRFTLEATQVGQWDLDLVTDTANRTLKHDQIFGYDALLPNWGYQTFLKHVHPEDRGQVEQAFEQAVAENKPWLVECRIIRTDQSVRWIWVKGVMGNVHLDETGKPRRMSGLVMDITERKRMESELRKYGADLTDADHRKNEFLAMLGHELRNPLSALAHGLDLQGRVQEDRARSEELRGMMARQTKRIVTLLDQLLDVARVISGKVDLAKDHVDLAEVVRAAVESCKPLMEAGKHVLTLTLPPEHGAFVMGDAVRLTQVVENLLTNAIKYTEEGGQIGVAIEWDHDKVRVAVRDTGIGMSAEFLPHVFEVFTQAPRTLDRAKGGLGLGLPLVRRLVDMHGGQVNASSAGPGQGSEFVVTLPLLRERRSKERLKREPALPVPAKVQSRRILIVDDEKDTADVLAELLEEDGHKALVVNDGPSALGAIGTFDPEVVLLDLGLPEMDGYEVARRLREANPDRAFLLIAVTGYQRDAVRLKQAGFDQHLIKPPNMQNLSALLAAWDGAGGVSR